MENQEHSLHIEAKKEAIADIVLLPGDPLRAKWIAENFLDNVVQFNNIRGMYGATGIYLSTGQRVTVIGSGMGMSSLNIYAHELITFYGVKKIIRLGSAGGLTLKTPLRSIVIAMGACTDSAINLRRFSQMSFAPIADWDLLRKAVESAEKQNIPYKVGNIISADTFYETAEPFTYDVFKAYGALAIEMETAELYTLAAKAGIQALSILTISNHFETEEELSPEDRESSFEDMVKIALEL